MDDPERELANLSYALGRLVDPVLRYCDGGSYSTQRARELRADLQADLPRFVAAVERYGSGYPEELKAIRIELQGSLVTALVHFTYEDDQGPQLTETFLEGSVRKITELLGKIPRRPLTAVLNEGSPFRFYTWFRALCENASDRLVIIDPYPSAALFTRYLYAVPSATPCVVVTRKRPGRDWDEFDAASALFSIERPATYQARLHNGLHDRFVASGATVYQIGTSIKDAAIKAAVSISSGNFGTVVEKYLTESAQYHPP